MPILRFPSDRIVGTLSWAGSYNEATGPVLATGPVEVPSDQEVELAPREILQVERGETGGWYSYGAQRPRDLSFLRDLPGDAIHTVRLHSNASGTLAPLVNLAPGLKRLYLGSTKLIDADLRHVAQLHHITQLQTYGNHFTDGGIQQLSSLRRMEDLCLEEETLTVAAFDFVPSLPNLARLDIWDVQMTDDEHAELVARLPGVDVGKNGHGE